MAIAQHWTSQIAVRADRADITSPRDLDGKTYGGFGAAYEVPKMQAVIRDAGGTGQFQNVVLGTAAYEALYAGQVDFTEPFVTWEGIEAQLRGQPLKTFDYTDYGFPDAYNVLLIGNGTWLQAHPDQARAFVQAVQRGYQLAADDPATGAELLEKANPGRVHRAGAGAAAASRCSASATCATSRARWGRRRRRSGTGSPGSSTRPARWSARTASR